MRCLSADMCRSWLSTSGLVLDDWLRVSALDDKSTHEPLYVVTEGRNLALPEFCRELLDWLPAGRERLLFTSSWSNYTPDHVRVFEAIRRGCGVLESLDDAPGHLFAATKAPSTHYEERPNIDVDEESIAMWLMALMLDWTWEGYAVVKGCRDIIYLGDGYVRFDSADVARLAGAKALIAEWGLKSGTEFPWTFAKPTSH